MKMWLRLDIDIPANTETEVEACLNFSNSFADMFGPGPIYQFGQPTGLYGEQNCELPEDWSLLGIFLPTAHCPRSIATVARHIRATNYQPVLWAVGEFRS